MTTELAQLQRRKSSAPGEISIFAARCVLFWERLAPAILPALGVPFALIIVSLFGWWRHLPLWLHWITLILAGAAFAAALWRDARGLRWPSRREAQERLEHDGGAVHTPLQALDDRPFDETAMGSTLWRAHLDASAERARKARLAGLRNTLEAADPYGFRFTAIGLFAIALIAAGGDWKTRLASIAAPSGAMGAGALVADLWIEPPAYTGKAPVYLMRAGNPVAVVDAQVDAPEGATLIAQINGRGRARLDFITNAGEASAEFIREKQTSRANLTLGASGLVRLRLGGEESRWPVGVLPDNPPVVAYTDYPAATELALLGFGYTVEDDYGVTAARLEMRLDPEQERPLDAPDFDASTLGEYRVIALEGAGSGSGERRQTLDLQADPWAGLKVLAAISVEDGAGQIGKTEEVSITLPTRMFFNPLAKTVIEQRQTLATAAGQWRRAGRSFDAVTLAPELFFEDPGNYLLLRAAFWRVMRQDGEGFGDAVEKFWPLALQLEDEALELARQRLEAAEEALREALERGASDKEIERLVEELRQAMNDYLQALAQAGEAMEQAPRGAEQLGQSDLDAMLDAIRDLAQSGAQNAARQMLSDLENMLNNLRLAQGGQGGQGGMPGGSGEGEGGAAGKAGEMIGRQRELADEAFQRGQQGGGPGAPNGDDLAQGERKLGGDLDELIDALQGEGAGGADPDGDAARSLGQARNNMREAEQALGNDDFDAATSAMERAIADLRDGAEELAREQMRQAAEGQAGDGQRGAPLDPLGRPAGNAYGRGVEVPGETDAGRTRAVIEELRRRLGEPGRSEEEIDYLERLLERF